MSRCARCDQEVTSGYVICNRCYKRMEEQVDGSRIINRIGIPAALEQLAEECAESYAVHSGRTAEDAN